MAKAELVIRITGNSKKFRAELDKVERESDKTIDALGRDGEKLTRKTKKESQKRIRISKRESNARIRNAKRVAAVLATLVVFGIGKSIRDFAAFEQGLAGVSKTTNIVGKDLENLGKEITKLSIKLGTSSTKLLQMAKSAGQLGIEGSKNILKFTEVIAGLEKTTNIVGEEGSIALARLIKVSGETTDNVDRLGSAIVGLGNTTAALENQILFTATEIAGAGKVFGITATQALGLAAAFSELAIRPELARSTILRAFGEIQKAISNGGKELEQLIVLTGLTSDQLEKTFAEDATRVFGLFLEGVGKLPKSEILPFLKSFNLAGLRLGSTLPKLATGSDLVNKKLIDSSKLYKENTALTTELAIQLDTTASRTKQAAEEYKAISRDIGEAFIPATESALEALRDLVPFIENNLVPTLQFLIDLVSQTAGGFKKLADSIGGFFTKLGVTQNIKEGPLGTLIDLVRANKAVETREAELEEILKKGEQARKDRLKREEVELKESLDTQHETKVEAAAREEARQAGIDELAKQTREERVNERLEKEQEERDEKLEKEQEQFEEDMEILDERLELAVAQVDESAIKEVGILQQKRIAKAKIDGLEDKGAVKREIALAKARATIEQAVFDNSLGLGISLLKATGVNSKAIFLVEKAAAIAKSIVATNVAATAALGVPPVPNFALSGATKLAGGINTATIIATAIGGLQGAVDGTVVSSGILGKDTEPFLLARNEIVLPSKANPLSPDFDETFGGGLGNQEVTVRIELTDEASQFITVGQREDTTLGVQR